MLNIVEYESDWSGEDAIVLHVYADAHAGVSGFTTFALTTRPPEAEVLHTPFGTPVQFAFTSAMEICRQVGIAHLVINDPGKLFAPDVRQMGPIALGHLVESSAAGARSAFAAKPGALGFDSLN